MVGDAEIFISYAHADNEHPRYESREWEQMRGWVECFYEALTRRLKQLRGRETHVWRDQSGEIKGSSALTDTIKDALQHCQVLLTITSPAYVASKWCEDELKFFREAAALNGGLRAGNMLRIVKVNKLPVSGATFLSRDPDLHDVMGYDLFRRIGGNPLEFDPPHGSELGQPFLLAINALAADIVEILDGPKIAESGISVYVAETSADVEDLRGKIRSELAQFGHTLLPAPGQPSSLAQVRSDLTNVQLSLHVLGSTYDAAAEMQYDLAGEASQPNFTRLTWLPPGVAAADERQAAFIERVRSSDAQFVTVPLEDVKTMVKDALKPKAAERKPARDEVRIVYLIFEPPDEVQADTVSDWLFEQGFEVLKPTRSGSLKTHKINLRDSHGVLIFYGQPDDEWLNVKLADLRKTFGQGRDKSRPLKGAVYLADPEEPQKVKFRSQIVDVIPGFGRFRPEILKPFISSL